MFALPQSCKDIILSRAYSSKNSEFVENLNLGDVGTTSVDPRTTKIAYDETTPEPMFYIVTECDNSDIEVSN